MIPAVSRSPAAKAGMTSLAADREDSIQRRIALFAAVSFLISLGFYGVRMLIEVALLHVPVTEWFTRTYALAHLGGSAVMGFLWLATGLKLASATLSAIEGVAVIATCTGWALMNQPDSVGGHALLALIATVNLRATIVPSTATRTFVITLLASVPLIIVHAVFLFGTTVPGVTFESRLAQSIGIILWIASGVAIATLASRVIYGLRKQVAEARDIGQYSLERRLGAGGMGEVWLARHRLLIREAAVKIIRPAALGSHPAAPEVLLRRFEREARATAALRSPHTVQLYDFGIADDGTLYYVMELLDGLDLETLVTRYGPVPADRARKILEQACHSLAEAHRAGLIHRDIKPANLFLSRADLEHDFVKILDFGLVKLGADQETSLRLTEMGSATGTPAYMAPEVVNDAHVDHRADLYSLGCVGYFLLTGRLVFEGDNPTKVMLAHANEEPVPPSARTEMPVPKALEDVITSLLAKKPSKRPQTAIELARRLEALELPDRWTSEAAERWWKTHMPEEKERPIAEVLLSHESRPRPEGSQILKVRARRPD